MPVLLGLALLVGCDRSIEFRPLDYEAFEGRNVLVLTATQLEPLPAEIVEQVQARVEEVLLASPYLGAVLTREGFRERNRDDRITQFKYELLSDTVSVLGIADRELSASLAESQGADLAGVVQVLHLPCPNCQEKKPRIAITVQLIDLRTSELRWRLHLSRIVDNDVDAETLAEDAAELAEELVATLDHLIKPKWHRLRFEHLR